MLAKTLFGLVAAVALSACGGKDEPKPEAEARVDPTPHPPIASGAGSPTKPTAKPPEPAQAMKSATVGPDLKMLPSDAELVLGIAVGQVVESPVWGAFVEPRVMSDKVKGMLAEFKTRCGFDPMTAVSSAVAGIKGDAGGRSGVVVVHGPDKAKVTACMDKMKDKAEIVTDGDVTTVKPNGGEPFALSFTGDDTAVVVFGANANAEAVKAATAGTGKLDAVQAFVTKFNKLDTSRPAWMVMTTPSKAFDALGAFGIEPIGAYGSAGLANGVDVDFRMVLDSPDKATASAQTLKSQFEAAKSFMSVDKLECASDGSDFKIVASVTGAKLPKLLEEMKKMAAMLGGGKAGMTGP